MRTWLTNLVYACILLAGVYAQGEYRVFVLKIEDSTTGQSREVTTTLDHLQYPEYNPVRSSEKVSISSTWMCRNRSDISQDIEQKYCPNPRGPASNSAGSPSAGGLGKATFTDPKPATPSGAQP